MPRFGGDQFLSLLDADLTQAARKYEILRSKLIFYFRHHGAQDPDNLADEVILRVIRRLDEGVETYSGIPAYCFGVADFVLREERRRPQTDELPDEGPRPATPSPSKLTRSEQSILVKQCLKGLEPVERSLLSRYYLDDREKLAEVEGMTPNSLRIRVFRIRQKMQEQQVICPKRGVASETS